MKSRVFIRKTAVILFWLVLWQAGSVLIDNSIIFVGPLDMVMALLVQLPSLGFWKTIAFSFGKISLGFLSAFFLGILLGSGGYRFPLLRELLADSDVILMDEPFTGLDEQTKQHVIGYIKEKTAGKLVLITTHQEEDVALLGGVRITLKGQAGLPEQS